MEYGNHNSRLLINKLGALNKCISWKVFHLFQDHVLFCVWVICPLFLPLCSLYTVLWQYIHTNKCVCVCVCVCVDIPILSVLSRSVVFNSLWPHGLGPTRVLCPWNFPGKNTRMGCHFLLQCVCVCTYYNMCVYVCLLYMRNCILFWDKLCSPDSLDLTLFEFTVTPNNSFG